MAEVIEICEPRIMPGGFGEVKRWGVQVGGETLPVLFRSFKSAGIMCAAINSTDNPDFIIEALKDAVTIMRKDDD